MPFFERDDVVIHWEESGSGYPILVFAPGGMRSSIEFWERAPFDPRRALGSEFRVIAMDQRNAGRSRAPITSNDGWDDYARDHLALLDHLGIERCHLMGGCIGSSFCLGVIQAAPERVSAAVLQNPIGLDQNRGVFFAMFDGWAGDMKKRDPDLEEQSLAVFRQRMYGEDFTFNVTRDFVRGVATPLLILAGDDQYHPTSVAREIAELAPEAELVLEWKEPVVVPRTVERVREFFRRHTPEEKVAARS
ncbi:MAG TPA: alpha/beta hydrolase [Thermoanaerobaculia bacterium]|nr:alpha/beta hydrolase [Thermoanaerobaculia bacterium]